MPLKMLDHIRRSVGLRWAFWYSAIFVSSSIVLFGLAYFSLSSILRKYDRDNVQGELTEFVNIYREGGLEALEKEVDLENQINSDDPFFVRLAGPENNILFLNTPKEWTGIDLRQIEHEYTTNKMEWMPLKLENGRVEILSYRLPDNHLIQVGKGTENRELLLESFHNTFLVVAIPMILFGFIGGIVLAFHTLQPIRELISTLGSIIETGKISARVPTRGTNDELDVLGVLFNNMLTKIEVLINGMRNSLDNASHDLRTPMTRLRGMAEVALQSDQDADVLREALLDCIEESERILAMLNTLMNISEAETGVMQLNLEKVNILTLIHEVVDVYNYVAEEKGISIHLYCPEELPLSADRNRISQVFANLLDNAIKYTPCGGRIDIESYQERHWIIITFKDTGPGILPEEIPQIWDRLFRGDKSRSQRGHGLGLSLVKAITQAHKGYVDVFSKPEAGSTFFVYLPQ